MITIELCKQTGIAKTGSGKTLAFLCPGVVELERDESSRALVLAPTRELAVQIFDVLTGIVQIDVESQDGPGRNEYSRQRREAAKRKLDRALELRAASAADSGAAGDAESDGEEDSFLEDDEIAALEHELSLPEAAASPLFGAVAYGGGKKSEQLEWLTGSRFWVATPGRLIDFMTNHRLSVEEVNFMVLDEADRMLDLGFEDQVRGIVRQTSCVRQTMFFSATWPTRIQKLAKVLCYRKQVLLSVGQVEGKSGRGGRYGGETEEFLLQARDSKFS